MTFEETLVLLGETTKEIEVVATKWWSIGGEEHLAIRSGSAPAGIDFHDPIIDGSVFMICGDIFTIDHKEETSLEELAERFDEHYVRLRAVSGVPYTATVDLGNYDILGVKKIESEWLAHVRLSLKRTGML